MADHCSPLQLEDHEYKPLDPKDIRLPPPMPPSERLLAAVEAFYSPPSHDRPRNRYGARGDQAGAGDGPLPACLPKFAFRKDLWQPCLLPRVV